MGSAFLLVGLTACGDKKAPTEHNDEAMITRTVDSLELLSSENGIKKNMVKTPIVETHALAKDPFDEYRLGIETRGYDEETGLENFRVTADYALHFTHRGLWDLKGNVSVVGQEGRRLFTQQLFWDEKLEKFYSNVDTKVTDGPSATVGTGFEADENLDRWSFRQITGVIYVDTDPTEPAADSLSVSSADSLLVPSATPPPVGRSADSEPGAGAGAASGNDSGAKSASISGAEAGAASGAGERKPVELQAAPKSEPGAGAAPGAGERKPVELQAAPKSGADAKSGAELMPVEK